MHLHTSWIHFSRFSPLQVATELIFLGVFTQDTSEGAGPGSEGIVRHVAFQLLGHNLRSPQCLRAVVIIQQELGQMLCDELEQRRINARSEHPRTLKTPQQPTARENKQGGA